MTEPEDSPTVPALSMIDALQQAPEAQPGDARPAVKRLLKAEGSVVIAATFAPGQAWSEHQAAHPILVQCLAGALDFTAEGEQIRLAPGMVAHLPARVRHQVVCAEGAERGVLLLTMLTAASD